MDTLRPLPKVRLRSDLTFRFPDEQNSTGVIVEDPVRNLFFQVAAIDYQILQALSGQRSTVDVCRYLQLDESKMLGHVEMISRWALQQQLACAVGADPSPRLVQMRRDQQQQQGWNRWNLVSIQLPSFNPTAILDRLAPLGRILFHPLAMLVFALGWASAGWYLWQQGDRLAAGYQGILAGGKWLWLLVIWIVLKVIHELGHGLLCRKFGGDVPQAGMALLLFAPLAFVNVTSSWRFTNRWQRMGVAMAGMYFELWIALLAAAVWLQSNSPNLGQDLAYNILLMASVNTLIFNANPLMRFDGYYVLSDLLRIPNLYSKGFSLVVHSLQYAMLGIPLQPSQLGIQSRRELILCGVYGVLATVWKYLVCIGLVIAASCLFDGLGLVLGVIAAVAWLVLPLIRWGKGIWRQRRERPVHMQWVIASVSCVLLGISIVWGWLQSPPAKSAPALVQFGDEQVVRAAVEGMVAEICVTEGQTVEAGQCLAILRNPELAWELSSLNEQIRQQELRARQAQHAGKIADYQATRGQIQGLEKQKLEIQDQVNHLQVTAPIAGVVMGRRLHERIGTLIKKGDELLTVVDPQSVKLVVAIPQQEFAAFAVDDIEPLRAKFPGTPVLNCPIRVINPKASIEPNYRAMCADAGGPLPVKPKAALDEGEKSKHNLNRMELLEPHFYVEVNVPQSGGTVLRSGQLGWAVFSARRQSLGSYLWLQCQQWFDQKVRLALGQQ